jgi:peptide/nickel transport system substrate-binding protein
VHAAPTSLDPADSNQTGWALRRNISRLIFDTLVSLDDRGRPQPALATAWQFDPGNQQWQFAIRRGVVFHDGAPLTSDVVAASLRVVNPGWKIFPAAEAVIVETASPTPDFPAELALSRNAIVKRDGRLFGTGPFAITRWEPGRKLALSARDDYWGSRAFIDSIEIEMGASFREQMISLDLGKTDLIEVAPEQMHRASAEGRRIENSAPLELMALVFTRERQSPEEGRLREALALSIDRGLLNNVLLQGGGAPAGSLLPNWMSGYAFLFPVDVDVPRARQMRDEVGQVPLWTLGYDASDPVARVVAERVALNARDAGLRLQPTMANDTDLRLARIPVVSLDAGTALATVATTLGLTPPALNSEAADELYLAEAMLLQSQRVIPLLHLRSAFAVGGTVRNWTQDQDGSWRLQEVWLGTEKP